MVAQDLHPTTSYITNIQQTIYSATPIFVDYQEFGTPYHPWTSIEPLTVLKQLIIKTLWDDFTINFNSEDPCTYHFVCPCQNCYQNFTLLYKLLTK